MISSSGILSVDLSAIQKNWSYVASTLQSDCKCAAVVKADAYSVGALEVVQALYATGCKTYFVATLEEAVELRNFLPEDALLYVLGGVREGVEPSFVNLRLTPVLYSLNAVQQWLNFCELRQRAFPCALKIDTGMTRLGLTDFEFEQILSIKSAFFNPVLFMSHLACADTPDHPLNESQLDRFQLAIAKIKNLYPDIKTSLANSSGTFLGRLYHFDMVRIGAALYGINPQPQRPNPLDPVLNLKLPILQIRNTECISSIGYGAEAFVGANTRLAVTAGGYADGIHRTLGLSPNGRINGVNVKSVGRISMDSCVFDITPIEDDPVYITVIDKNLTLDVLIESNKSLGYEVLTSLGRRYQRHYYFGGKT